MMDEVAKCTESLVQAIKDCKACTEFRETARKIGEKPELKEQIVAFRRKNYELQNQNGSDDLFEEMQQFEREYEEFCSNPLVHAYLDAELQVCRILQHCSARILTAVDLEIEDFADVIEL